MKQEAPPVRAFIRDYKLKKPGGIVCFTATVHFRSFHITYKLVSHVHIITIAYKHLDVIYLLNPDIDVATIKTMFTNNQHFHYSATRRFEIRGRSKRYGHYSIFIIPINNDCGEETTNEVNAKMQN